ncbi:hypothetical protein [uncultured Sphingomonas sp.]|uniref:hypothetical protein n=1 Tax=uncultured Sphingomonas sp. TaxID=158754 RepID=UPI0035CB9B05
MTDMSSRQPFVRADVRGFLDHLNALSGPRTPEMDAADPPVIERGQIAEVQGRRVMTQAMG